MLAAPPTVLDVMASDQQFQANRLHAPKSTGPQSPEGKSALRKIARDVDSLASTLFSPTQTSRRNPGLQPMAPPPARPPKRTKAAAGYNTGRGAVR